MRHTYCLRMQFLSIWLAHFNDAHAIFILFCRACRFCRTLARSYQEDAAYEEPDQEKIQMLEQYLASREAADADAELPTSVDAPIPTRAEDVDRFMAELVRATPATHMLSIALF